MSAVKIGGERAYELARRGVQFETKSRMVEIFSFMIERSAADSAHFQIQCSKGTYIRSIARDLGAVLGCGGALATLRRERSEPFGVEEAVQVNEVSNRAIIPWSRLFPEAPTIEVTSEEQKRLAAGDERC